MRRRVVPCIFLFIVAIAPSSLQAWAEEFAWITHMGSTGYDYGSQLVIDGNGNSYLFGTFEGTVNFGPYDLISAGSVDSFVAKLDSNGTVQWAIRMGGSAMGYASDVGTGIAVDQDNDAYVTGRFSGAADFGSYDLTARNEYDLFVARLEGNGTVQWAMRMGGAGNQIGSTITLDRNDNLYLAGSFAGAADFGSYSLTAVGSNDIFVAKLNEAGTVQWAMRMGGSSSDEAQGIALDKTNDVYVTGTFFAAGDFGRFTLTPERDSDTFVAKLNGNGKVRWALGMGGFSSDIATDGAGNVYVTGFSAALRTSARIRSPLRGAGISILPGSTRWVMSNQPCGWGVHKSTRPTTSWRMVAGMST